MRSWAALLGGLVVLFVLGELAVAPVAERTFARELDERGIGVGEVELTRVERPALLGLVTGSLRDVELVATAVGNDALQVEQARLSADELGLAWGRGTAEPMPASLRLRVSEAQLEAALVEQLPAGLDPGLELTPGTVALDIGRLPVTLEVEVEVDAGVLRLAPAGRVPAWFASLGMDLRFPLPDEEIVLEQLRIEDGVAIAHLRIDLQRLLEELEPDGGRR